MVKDGKGSNMRYTDKLITRIYVTIILAIISLPIVLLITKLSEL